jgi:hypothetical protein
MNDKNKKITYLLVAIAAGLILLALLPAALLTLHLMKN